MASKTFLKCFRMFEVPQKIFLDHKTQNKKFSSGGVVTLLKTQPGGGKIDVYKIF